MNFSRARILLFCVFCARTQGGKIDRSWALLSANRSEKTALVITTPIVN